MKAVIGMVVAALLLTTGAQTAVAEQAPGSGPGPAMQEGRGKERTQETFSERKARIQKMLEERKTRLAQEKTCVDAAKNDEDLMKCRPQRPMMREGEGMQGGRGGMGGQGQQQQRPPMGGAGDMR